MVTTLQNLIVFLGLAFIIIIFFIASSFQHRGLEEHAEYVPACEEDEVLYYVDYPIPPLVCINIEELS